MRKLLFLPLLLTIVQISEAQNNMGIGTAFPNSNALLELQNNGNPLGLLLPRQDTGTFVAIGPAEAGLMVYNPADNRVYTWNGANWISSNTVWGNNGPSIYNLNAGNVGIGTNTPAFPLDIFGNINISAGSAYYIGGNPILKINAANNSVSIGNGSGLADISNTFVGANSGAVTTGGGNVFVGSNTGLFNTTGGGNTYIGLTAGINANGNGNTYIGEATGGNDLNASGNNLITLLGSGANVDAGASGLNNATAIGAGATVNASNRLVLGSVGTAVQFDGELRPGNNPGAAGEVLISGGPGVTPTWGSASGIVADNGLTLTGTDLDLGGTINQNTIFALNDYAFTVGTSNTIAGPQNAEIILGNSNTVTGTLGIAIGTGNTVSGNRGVALGSYVQANHLGAFVIGDWSGSSPGLTASSTNDQFTARFNAGYRFYASSDPIANPNEGLFINNAGQVGIGTFAPSASLEVNSTDAVIISDGTTAQRPAATVGAGAIRYNSEIGTLEYSDGAQWHSLVPPGTIVPFAGSTPPEGWLLCNGAFYDRTTYSKLFAAIGTAWGTDLPTNFRVPDARGKFLRGVDGGAGFDPDAAARIAQYTGGNGGNAVGSFQTDATARPNTAFSTNTAGNHTHSFGGFNNLNSGFTSYFFVESGNQPVNLTTGAAGDHAHSITAGGDNETRPVNIYVNYIIKY